MAIALRTAGVFLLKISAAVIGFVLQVLLANSLGITDYGEYSLFVALSNVIIIFPLLGMNTGLIKEIAATSNIAFRKEILRFSEKIFLILLVGTLIIWFFVAPYVMQEFSLDISIACFLGIYTIIYGLTTLLGGYIQGEQKNIFNDGITTVVSIVRLIVIYLMFLYSENLLVVLNAYVFAEFIGLLVRITSIELELKPVKIENVLSVEERKAFLKYCLPLFFVSSISIIQFNIHRFIVAGMMDSYSVGVMKVCENYSSALGLFVMPFVTFWPIMSEYYHKHEMEKLKRLFKEGSIAITIMIIPAFVTMLVCVQDTLGIFHLDVVNDPKLAWVFFFFSIGTIYDAIIGPAGAMLNMTHYSYVSFYNSFILLICTVSFSCLLIPHFGIIGAAIALSLSHIVINTLNAYQNKRLFGLMPYGREQLEIIVLGIVTYGLLTYMNINSLFQGIVNIIFLGVITYLVFIIYFFTRYKETAKALLSNFNRLRSNKRRK